MSQPHDALFKLVFGEPAALRGFLRDVLPPEVVPLLDLSQLTPLPTSQVNDKLAVRIPDLLYQAPWRGGGQAQLAVVMEHQSSPDPRMPLRALRTTMRVWEQAMEDPTARLPVVLTLVVTHGARPWSAPTKLSELYDAPPEAVAALRPYLPELVLFVEDLAVIPDSALPGDGGARLALILLRHAHEGKLWRNIEDNVPLFQAGLSELGVNPSLGMLEYAMKLSEAPWDDALRERLLALLNPPEREVIMSYFYRQMEASREEGIQLGRESERALFAEALEQERVRNAQEFARSLLTRRFGPLSPEDEAALSAASIDALKAVPEHIFTATSAAEVLRAIGVY